MSMKLRACDLRLLTGVALAAATSLGALAACSSDEHDATPAATKKADAGGAAGDDGGGPGPRGGGTSADGGASGGSDGGSTGGMGDGGETGDGGDGGTGVEPTGPTVTCAFADAGTPFSLPSAVTSNGGDGLYLFGALCSGANGDYTVADIDGDGLDDLVESEDCTAGKVAPVGVSEWLFWKGTRSGFAATSSTFTLPSSAVSPGLFGYGGNTNVSHPISTFVVYDLDHDGRVDLVNTVAGGFTGPIGVSRWDYYKGTPTGFATTASSWVLPAAAEAPCHPGIFDFGETSGTVDVDGDGFLDLVETQDCTAQAGPVGVTHWLVFKGSATGFASTATTWALPPIVTSNGSAGLFTYVGDGSKCTGSDFGSDYQVRDFDGDGIIDLVETFDCGQGTAGPVGVTQWTLFKGTASGFDPTPRPFALPPAVTAGGSAGLFYGDGPNDPCTNGKTGEFKFSDFDGDGLLDLVQMQDCTELTAGPIGKSQWAMYKGTSSGFSPSPSPILLPPVATAGQSAGLFSFGGSNLDCQNGLASNFTVASVSGGKTPDLVQTYDCVEGSAGPTSRSQWVVFSSSCH